MCWGLAAVVLGDGGVSSGAVSEGLRDLDRVSGAGDAAVCGVNSVMSAGVRGLCGVDTMVSGVDGSVCGVNSVMSAGVRDLCGVDTVVSGPGADDPVCGGNSAMTDGELDVCARDRLLYTGDSSGVEVVVSVDDVVACGDNPLLPDAVRFGGWLPVVGDTFVCDSVEARSGRGDPEVVVGPRVVQPGWVDGLICADGSLQPEPPPMHAMCLRRMLLAAAC